MFRITTHAAGDELVMRLEGCLIGPWVEELDACWRQAAASSGGRSLTVDLGDVCHVDDSGRALMTAMVRAGVRFVARGCLMPELLREISESVAMARGS